VNTSGLPSQSSGQPTGQSLGQSLWERHTQTALNGGVRAGVGTGLGASIHDRHTAFVASPLQRAASSHAAGADAQSRPVVIGRRAYADPEQPESIGEQSYVVPRAHVVPQALSMSRNGASAGDIRGRALDRPVDTPVSDVVASRVDFSNCAANSLGETTRDSGQASNAPRDAAPARIAVATNQVDEVSSVERLADEPVVAASWHGGIDRAPVAQSGAVPVLRAAVSGIVGSVVEGKAVQLAISPVGTGQLARGALVFRQAADALQSIKPALPGPMHMPKPTVAVLWPDTQHALAQTPEGAQRVSLARSVLSAARDVPRDVPYDAPHALMRRVRESRAEVGPLSQHPLAIAMRVVSSIGAASEVFRARVRGSPVSDPLREQRAPVNVIPTHMESRADRMMTDMVAMPLITQESVGATANRAAASELTATDTRIHDARAPINRSTSSATRQGVGARDADESVAARIGNHEPEPVAAAPRETAVMPVETPVPHLSRALAADRMRETPGLLAGSAAAHFSTTHAQAIVGLLRGAGTRPEEPRAVSRAATNADPAHWSARMPTPVSAMPGDVPREQGVDRVLAMQAFDPVQDRPALPAVDRSPERVKTDAPALTAAPTLQAGAPLLHAAAINRVSAPDQADGERTRGASPNATALTDQGSQASKIVPAGSPSISTPPVRFIQTSAHVDPMPAIRARVDRQFKPARVQAAEPERSSVTTAARIVSTPQPVNSHTDSRVPDLLRVFAMSVPRLADAADADNLGQKASSSLPACSGTSGQDSVSHAGTIDRLADQYGVVPVDRQHAGPPPGGTHGAAQNASAIAKTATSAVGSAIDPGELAEQAWQIIQDKLAMERERRGFASWP
jgi:hypothetical protein